ncbi:MAG TPA: hypothetical protein VNK04_21415 [Gemmataceae bacterium]|nr:hypothetical protein [Gemmataceae bacterium]
MLAPLTQPDPMTQVLATFRLPEKTDFADAWVGMEPTFQTAKSIRKWRELSATPEGEDEYFTDGYMLSTQKKVAKAIKKKYEKWRKEKHPYCMFDRVERDQDRDQWKVRRQNLIFHWADEGLEPFVVRFTLDPETFEYSIKPVPLAWFYDDRFLGFLEEFLWKVPQKKGLMPSIGHGGAQFSISAKTFLGGSLLADDIAAKLNHPELATWIMDYPNCDDRSFRGTRQRFRAFQEVLRSYWAGAFHPRAIGTLTVENCYLDRGFDPAPSPPEGLMDPQKGPVGSPQEVFQTNFAFGRAVRLFAQNVHPGYWQAAHPKEDGYRPDQIMRYGEGNLNRLQIVGEFHVKSGKVLNPERVVELDTPLDITLLYEECSWENRAQYGRTSARDFVEALLLDVHHARYLQAHPHVSVKGSLLQDQLLYDAEETIKRHGPPDLLARLHREAREYNLEYSRGRMKTDWIEPEVLFWEAWKVLPVGERAAIAREVVAGFLERVEEAASADPRPAAQSDPMEWHRHRVHPVLWEVLEKTYGSLKASDPVRRELRRWQERKDEYLARRPVFSPVGDKPPWEEE